MLDRIEISDERPGIILISQKDEVGITIANVAVPEEEWQELKAKLMSSGKLNGDFTNAFYYLLALWVLLEQS